MTDQTPDNVEQAPERSRGERGREPHDGTEARTQLLDYVRVAYKRRWTIATVFTLVLLTFTIWTYTTVPVYEAKAQLLIEPENQNVVTFKEVLEQDKGNTDYYQTQYTILRSRSLASKAMDALGPRASAEIEAAAQRGDSSGAAASTGSSKDAETAVQAKAIDAFLAHLEIVPVRNSRLVDVRYRSTNPTAAADAANALAKAYIEQSLDFKFTASKDASDWLGQRLAEQRKLVEGAEAAVQQYKEKNDAVALDERQNIVVQKLADLNAAVTKAKTERIDKESLYRQIQAVQDDPAALGSIPAVLSSTYIQQLKSEVGVLRQQAAQLSEKLGDLHPDMIKAKAALQASESKLQAEIAKVGESIHNEYQTALTREKALMGALEAQKQEALALNGKAIGYNVLARDKAVSQQFFDNLLQRAKETGISSELRTTNIRIVDRAEVPRTPVLPQKAQNLLFGALGGAALGLGLAFLFEHLDNGIKTPDDIKRYLGLPFLGFVPVIREREVAGRAPLLNNAVPANFAEAFRVVRTNVLFSSANEGGRSLLVTSAGPGEGKSLVASNLAVAIAQAGQNVLLIDADMRRPRAHDIFQISQEPGLSNVLVGNAKTTEAIRKSGIPGLWILPSGRTPPNPAELLGSKRFKDFLASLGQHFGWVIVDSPPVMAVADGSVAAHVVSSVLFVVAAEKTSRHTAAFALEQLAGLGAYPIGAVLNRIDLERNAYYHSHYYGRGYAQYYSGQSKA